MVTSVRDCDFVVLVTEPTPFGLHDLAAGGGPLLAGTQSACGVIVNRAEAGATLIHDYCQASRAGPYCWKYLFPADCGDVLSAGGGLLDALS